MIEFSCAVIWLIMAGASFALSIRDEDSTEKTLGLFLFCLVLAPFSFGAAIAEAVRNGNGTKPKTSNSQTP